MRRAAALAIVAVLLTPFAFSQVLQRSPCASSQAAQQGPLRVAPKPSDIPAHWKPLIGVYEQDGKTIDVLENCGQLYLFADGAYYRLNNRSGNDFRLSPPFIGSGTARLSGPSRGQINALVIDTQQFQHTFGEDTGKSFRIAPLRSPDELRNEALSAQPPRESGKRAPALVELTKLDPTIKLDVRYATSNNFMGVPFYRVARAFLQRPAAAALVRAHRKLKAYGYGVLIHDAYRPWYVTKMFWDATPSDKKDFVADPAKGSNHNRGGAVDLSLYELSTGKPVRMPGGYDEMSARSYPGYPGGTSLERWHRDLLRAAMESEGFRVYKVEWWHFDFRDYSSYPVLNLPFDRISPSSKTESNQRQAEKR